MQIAEPVSSTWKASLDLGFTAEAGRSVLSSRRHDGPLVVQKPLYPEGEGVCHAIIVHPPGGIAGGDALSLTVEVGEGASALLTTPGAAKWYRSAGPLATQDLRFRVRGRLEWLPQETIVFDGARSALATTIDLAPGATFLGWDLVCLGRRGSGERFTRGRFAFDTRLRRDGALLWMERGALAGGSRLLASPAGLGGRSVYGTLVLAADAIAPDWVAACRAIAPEEGEGAVTRLPGVLLARYLGESGECARDYFRRLWHSLRPAVAGREACDPRIWAT